MNHNNWILHIYSQWPRSEHGISSSGNIPRYVELTFGLMTKELCQHSEEEVREIRVLDSIHVQHVCI